MLRLFGKKVEYTDPAQALDAGDLETALTLYRQRAARERRAPAQWQKKVAEVLALMGRTREAAEAYLVAATSYERDDRMLQAVALYKAVLRLEPGNVEVQQRLDALAAGGQPPPAGDPMMTIRTRLSRHAPLFSEFDREELTGIVEVMELHRLPAGHVVFEQGAAGDALFVVVQGEVLLTVRSKSGPAVEVARAGEGSCFGEVSTLTRAPRNVTATTTVACELLELPRDYLDALAIEHPRVWDVLEQFQKARRIPAGI